MIHNKKVTNSCLFIVLLLVLSYAQSFAATNIVPKGLRIVLISSEKVKLEWEAINDAKLYEIYRSYTKNGTYIKVGLTKENTFEDKDLLSYTEYFYKVKVIEPEVSDFSTPILVKTKANQRGNTIGNIFENGKAAQQGKWIYYRDSYNHLCKIDLDGKNKQVISKDSPLYIQVIGDWIYYVNFTKYDLSIVKIQTNGKKRTTILKSELDRVIVLDNWIYFTSYHDIYKIDTFGKNKSLVYHDKNLNIEYLTVLDGWLYYNTYNGLYKIKTNGSSKKQLSNEYLVENFNIQDGCIYYQGINDQEKALYKIKLDGSNKTKIVSNSGIKISFNIYKDWIYFENEFTICKMRLDGTEKTLVYSNKNKYVYINGIVNDWIYFGFRGENDPVETECKMKLDGTGFTRLDSKEKNHSQPLKKEFDSKVIKVDFPEKIDIYKDNTECKITLQNIGTLSWVPYQIETSILIGNEERTCEIGKVVKPGETYSFTIPKENFYSFYSGIYDVKIRLTFKRDGYDINIPSQFGDIVYKKIEIISE